MRSCKTSPVVEERPYKSVHRTLEPSMPSCGTHGHDTLTTCAYCQGQSQLSPLHWHLCFQEGALDEGVLACNVCLQARVAVHHG